MPQDIDLIPGDRVLAYEVYGRHLGQMTPGTVLQIKEDLALVSFDRSHIITWVRADSCFVMRYDFRIIPEE